MGRDRWLEELGWEPYPNRKGVEATLGEYFITAEWKCADELPEEELQPTEVIISGPRFDKHEFRWTYERPEQLSSPQSTLRFALRWDWGMKKLSNQHWGRPTSLTKDGMLVTGEVAKGVDLTLFVSPQQGIYELTGVCPDWGYDTRMASIGLLKYLPTPREAAKILRHTWAIDSE